MAHMMVDQRFQRKLAMAALCLLCCSFVAGEDVPSAKPTATAEQRAALESIPAIKKANATFSVDIKTAETNYASAKRKASEKRLAAYRDQLKSLTKAGDFDKAVACKAIIEEIESNESVSTARPRPKDTVKFDGHSYALIEEPATWHVAKQRCEEMGGHLAFVKGGKEYGFIYKLAGKNRVYLGATDEEREGHWKWTDGTPWMSNPWEVDNAGGNSHYLTLDGQRNVLDDYPIDRLQYVCEWDD